MGVKVSIYRLVLPGDFFRVEEFTDLLVFVNCFNWKILRHINDVLGISTVVVIMFLLPMRKVNIVEFLIQTIWV